MSTKSERRTPSGDNDASPPATYRSAAEELQALLPRLADLAKATRGQSKATWRVSYLEALSHCANVTIASRIAGVSREAVRLARKDLDFASKEKDAMETGIDLVEASAFKSAVHGDMKPVYQQGMCVGHVLEYSDAMRALLLKGRRSDVFREKVEHSGEVTHKHLTLDEISKRLQEAKP